jgi:tetratricopeptide (TPR) repeat protein
MDYPKAMEYAEQSIDCYTRAGKNRHRLWVLMEKSSLFRTMNEDAEGIRIMEALLPEIEATNDMALFSGCLGELILGCLDENRLADARKYYDRYVQKINPMTKNTALLSRIAQLYAYEGSFSEAQRFMEAAWEKANDRADSIILYVTSSLIHRKKGNDRQAYADLEDGVTLQNKDVRKTLQHPILTTQMDFLRQELAFQHYKQRTEKVIWMLGIGLVVILAGIAIYGIRKRMRQRVMRIQEEKARLEEDLEVLQTTQEKTEALKNGLFESKMKELDKLVLVSLKEFKNEESRNRAILKLVQDTKDQIHGNKKNMANLEKWVNEYKDNVMQHLRSEIVLPDESYYELACYLLANFSVNTIALLMDETTNTIYKRRSRIRLLIQDSSAWHKEQFQQI